MTQRGLIESHDVLMATVRYISGDSDEPLAESAAWKIVYRGPRLFAVGLALGQLGVEAALNNVLQRVGNTKP